MNVTVNFVDYFSKVRECGTIVDVFLIEEDTGIIINKWEKEFYDDLPIEVMEYQAMCEFIKTVLHDVHPLCY